MLIGTAAAGVGTVTVITLQYLPQFLYWNNGTVPTGLQVSVAGDGVITNLDGAGIDAFNRVRMPGTIATGYYMQLANGLVPNKVTTITFTNGVAAAINLFGFSFMKGTSYNQRLMESAVAPSGSTYTKFRYFACPNAVTATDIFNIEFADGTVQQFDLLELRAINGFWQNNVAATVAGIENSEGIVKKVQFTPAITQNVYIERWAMVGNVSQSA